MRSLTSFYQLFLFSFLEPCLDRDSTCNPKADKCCAGLRCIQKSGTTDFICGSLFESVRKFDEGILFRSQSRQTY